MEEEKWKRAKPKEKPKRRAQFQDTDRILRPEREKAQEPFAATKSRPRRRGREAEGGGNDQAMRRANSALG
jgi:hypothetical protein